MSMPRFAILQSVFGVFWRAHGAAGSRQAAADKGHRWQRAFGKDERLKHDLIELGGLFEMPPVTMANGQPQPGTQDLYQCGLSDGRRALATQLLALGGLTVEDFNTLMEDDHDDH